MSSARRRGIASSLLALPLAALLALLLVWPSVGLLKSSVASGEALTLAHYVQIVREPAFREALWHSVAVSFGVAAAATILCLPPAWLLVRRQFPGKRVVRALFTVPMSFSGLIIGFLTIIMLGRIGIVPQLLEELTGHAWLSGAAYQLSGLLLAYLYFEIPRATLTLESALRNLDPRLEQAARSLGASPWRVFSLVVLPGIWPALLSAFAVTFSVSLGSFGVVLVVSKRFTLLPLELFSQIIAFQNDHLAAAMAVVLIVIALAVSSSTRLLIRDRLVS